MTYWTIPNLPLFLMAAPMLYILIHSSTQAWSYGLSESHVEDRESSSKQSRTKSSISSTWIKSITQADIMARIAIPQAALAMLALSTYHVQIIIRLSSGYPVWYWWLASLIINRHATVGARRELRFANKITKCMIAYTVVQAGLFASFLPPA